MNVYAAIVLASLVWFTVLTLFVVVCDCALRAMRNARVRAARRARVAAQARMTTQPPRRPYAA